MLLVTLVLILSQIYNWVGKHGYRIKLMMIFAQASTSAPSFVSCQISPQSVLVLTVGEVEVWGWLLFLLRPSQDLEWLYHDALPPSVMVADKERVGETVRGALSLDYEVIIGLF